MASIFSGSGGRKAAQAANKELNDGYNKAVGQLDTAKAASADYLNSNRDVYQGAYDNAKGLMDSAYGDARAQTADIAAGYQPYANSGQQANTAYSNAMGLNGAEGYNQAMQQFRTGPGYQFQMDQGLDALNRTAAARGGLASGNNSVDLMKYAQGMADQSWQQNLGNLNNQANMGMQATNGIANAKQGQAQLAMNYGSQGAQLAQGYGTQMAGINNTLAGNETNYGNTVSGMSTNLAGQMAQNTEKGMMAGQQAASNRFGAVMGGVQAGMSLLGMM